jgi:hypothetical protein
MVSCFRKHFANAAVLDQLVSQGVAPQSQIRQQTDPNPSFSKCRVAFTFTLCFPETEHSKLLRPGCYSDLTIKCQRKEFKVHGSVICLQSMFFAAAINGEFKVRKHNSVLVALDYDKFGFEFIANNSVRRKDWNDQP